MKFTLITALTLAIVVGTTQAAGIAACTANKDGTGPYDQTYTRICCQEQNMAGTLAQGKYDEKYHDCRTHITNGNGIDQGKMTECCSKNGLGSTAQ
ncbi:hypothetical protein E3Q17_01467 [Wallemia mellicola]|uniref:Uncharacterized protein n=1 Tax=Wallemia mellicola TaxID=1708541 RepID=A0A4T0TDB3_9BASI|nr:hypothetical protein E3Q17_01467 [Wallemia mellicola]TIC59807.1 hypothetical protein E3Q03_03710 [Wallemia mellicola]